MSSDNRKSLIEGNFFLPAYHDTLTLVAVHVGLMWLNVALMSCRYFAYLIGEAHIDLQC